MTRKFKTEIEQISLQNTSEKTSLTVIIIFIFKESK